MKLPRDVVRELLVEPGRPASLANRSTAAPKATWLPRSGDGPPSRKELAEQDLETFRSELARAQQLLYADGRWALLVVLQGLDAAGKDGTIKHVMSGVNPQGCEVVAFKEPSTEELRHDFLWRCARAVPQRGRIGIFNRSHYEEVVVCRVHPELLDAEHLPPGSDARGRLWHERYEAINAFERHLVRNGTRVVKLFLHVSKDEQRQRLLARLDDPGKRWKFSAADLAERAYFHAYRAAYEEALTATSTDWAPWYVVPADHKYALRALVGGIVVGAIDDLDLRLPPGDEATIARWREALEREG